MYDFEIFKLFIFRAWANFVILVILISLFLKSILKYENDELKKISLPLITFGIFCQQASNYKTNLHSTRFIVSFLFFASILTYNLYTSMVVSHLVDIKRKSEINSLSDLIESDVPIGFITESKGIINMLDVIIKKK